MKDGEKIQDSRKVAVILLAAGKSSRTKNFNKLSNKINGIPLLTHCYNKIKQAYFDQIIVVSSEENLKQVEELRDPCPQVVITCKKHVGIGYSISKGMNYLNRDISAVIICLSDTPLVSERHIELLLNSNKANNYNGIHRLYDVNNTPGHPVLFNADFFKDLKRLTGDIGSKNLIHKNNNLITKIKVNDHSPSIDLDTEDDWAAYEETLSTSF